MELKQDDFAIEQVLQEAKDVSSDLSTYDRNSTVGYKKGYSDAIIHLLEWLKGERKIPPKINF